MTTRAHLHRLTRQIRRYLARQKADGLDRFVPASDEERAQFEARRQKQQEQQLADLRSQITGDTQGESVPSTSTEKKGRSHPAPSVEKSDSDDEKAPSVTAETPLWKKHDAMHKLNARQKKKTRAAAKAKSRSSRSTAGGSGSDSTNTQAKEPPTDPETPQEKMAFLRHYLGDCQRCPLHEGRTNIVFGAGDPNARLMFVGEGPGYHEDQQGLPFVGKSGKLLTKMIHAMGLGRDEVYITNIVKCRPPDNRDPAPQEVKECSPFLKKQIAVVEPEVIVTLGRPAANTLLGTEDEALGRLRAKWHTHRGISVMPTYHPSYLLRSEPDTTFKKRAWEDLKKVMDKLGLK